ncbi:MAG TPA: HD domain-containing phosphohydrolase [Solirubrobacteraceae bacterium]|nr:HD domain-containing phosphohydrolase [Solirubrobacteraceae bacterium]
MTSSIAVVEDTPAPITITSGSVLGAEGELVETIQRLSLTRSVEEIQELVRSAARRLTGADGATFVLRDEERCYYADEDAISPLWKGQRFPMSTCISGWTMLNRQPVAIPDIFCDDRIAHEAYRPTFVRSLAMVPIRRLDPVGAIGNYWADHHEPSDREINLLQALADSTAVALENIRILLELDAARVESIERLALAAEYRDDGTHEHTARVAHTAFLLAQTLGLADEEAALIGQAAQLHDVGKLAIPDAILLKRQRLDDAEFAKLKTHTTAGAAILGGSQSSLLRPAEEVALAHHERWDGGGYPFGLETEAIPLSGRICAVADVFDALTHARPYKPAWELDEAISEIREMEGRQFDPTVVGAFLELEPGRLVELPHDTELRWGTPGKVPAAPPVVVAA